MVLEQAQSWDRPRAQSGVLPSLAVIADDLTGACDAAIAFTGPRRTVRVDLAGGSPSGADVWTVSTNTRDVAESEAEERLAQVASQISADQQVFKKIDSVFRGNTFTEILASIRIFPADLVVIAPGYPDLGRHIHGGKLKVTDSTCTREIAIAEELTQRGCRFTHLPAGASESELAEAIQASLAESTAVVLADSTEQSHLVSLVHAAKRARRRTLWIGSGGLAHALATATGTSERQPFASSRGHVIFFVGSDHPITKRQLQHLSQMTGIDSAICAAKPALSSGSLLLDIPRGHTRDEDIRDALDQWKAADVGCLFMTGGDTALQVCRALGIQSLRLLYEFAPGIPLGMAEGGRFGGIPVILKSGGFGQHDVLCRVLDAFSGKESVLAR